MYQNVEGNLSWGRKNKRVLDKIATKKILNKVATKLPFNFREFVKHTLSTNQWIYFFWTNDVKLKLTFWFIRYNAKTYPFPQYKNCFFFPWVPLCTIWFLHQRLLERRQNIFFLYTMTFSQSKTKKMPSVKKKNSASKHLV